MEKDVVTNFSEVEHSKVYERLVIIVTVNLETDF